MGETPSQIRLEADATKRGLARYLRQINRGVSRGTPRIDLSQSVMGPFVEAIRRAQDSVIEGKGKFENRVPLLSLDEDKLAFVTIQSILYLTALAATRGNESAIPVAEAERFIGEQCYLERCHDISQGRARDVAKLITRRNKNKSNARIRAKEQAKLADGDWTADERHLMIGAQLLALAASHTDLLRVESRVETRQDRPTTRKSIRLSDNAPVFPAPIHFPMIARPREWISLQGGGYLTLPHLHLVKHRNNPHIIEFLEKADLGRVFAAVNALQETPWRINKRVYSVMRRAFDSEKTFGGLPSAQHHQQERTAEAVISLPKDEAKKVVLLGMEEARSSDRVFAGLLKALERCETLDSTVIVERIADIVPPKQGNPAGHPSSEGPPSAEDQRKAFLDLVRYRLYQGFRFGQGLDFPKLERLGLAHIEYANLNDVCLKNKEWTGDCLLSNSSPARRQSVASVLLDHMRGNLAISDRSLQSSVQKELLGRVRTNLQEPWVFGDREKLRQGAVFLAPDVSAVYYLNEKSLRAGSGIGLRLRIGEPWGRAGKLSAPEYQHMMQTLLEVLQKVGILAEIKSARNKSGWQIRPESLRWVLDGGPGPAVVQLPARHSAKGEVNTRSIASRALMEMRMLWCEELVGAKRFYFPHQLDYRGRAYPMPQVISPQSDDIGRALIEFASGKLLGKRGKPWLAVHVANTYGYDKVSFRDRRRWVKRHDKQIRDLVSALEGHSAKGNEFWGRVGTAHAEEGDCQPGKSLLQFWQKADKPWCFLAACLEWVNSEQEGFRTHLPVAMDGTCNGLQHLSAMGRDQKGGEATNLVPSPSKKRQDIYQRVADLLIGTLHREAKGGRKEAQDWLDWLREKGNVPAIERKLVKRATMTTPYGVTPKGIREQLLEDGFTAELKRDEWGGTDLPQDRLKEWIWPGRQRPELFDRTDYLRKELEASIGEVVVKAKQIKEKLQNLATRLAKENLGVCWTTPAGFPVVVEHRSSKQRPVYTDLGKAQWHDTSCLLNVQRAKQRSTIVPNFIHSFDAAHMMLTVNRLHKKGLRAFAMVHDSYGVHASSVDLMNRVLREEFVRVHQEPALQELWDSLGKAHPGISVGEPPPLGDLVIEDVRRSPFFFS